MKVFLSDLYSDRSCFKTDSLLRVVSLEMVSWVFAYLLISAVSCSSNLKDKLSRLVSASIITRCYAPDSYSIREARVAETLLYHPEPLKRAIKAMMMASYSFVVLAAPLYRVYGKVAAAVLKGKPSPQFKRFSSAVKAFENGVPEVFGKVIDAYKIFPAWEEEGMTEQAATVMDELRDEVHAAVSALVALVRKPSYSKIIKSRYSLAFNFRFSLMSILPSFELRLLCDNLAMHNPKDLLVAETHALKAKSHIFEMRQWSHRDHFKSAIKEITALKDTSRLVSLRNLNHMLTSFLFSDVACIDFINQYAQRPSYELLTEKFPEDRARFQHISGIAEKTQIIKENLTKLLKLLNRLTFGMLHSSSRLEAAHTKELSSLISQIISLYDLGSEAERQELGLRMEFVESKSSRIA